MTYALKINVNAPVAMYDAVHAQVVEQTKGEIEGLLVHLATPTPSGFEVVEVWESREAFTRYNVEVIAPLLAAAPTDPDGSAAPTQQVEELDLRAVVIPQGGVVI
jgi:hypothetical protein